ncbi:hypothetical protein EBU71_17585, partial [bacterium]|nr:hypothetical protein [Candidatus Elulimicrobium humile]
IIDIKLYKDINDQNKSNDVVYDSFLQVFSHPKYTVEFTPSLASAHRLKLQSQIHSDSDNFTLYTEKNNIKVKFGNAGSNSSNFVFQNDIDCEFKRELIFPIQHVLNILNMEGNITMSVNDGGKSGGGACIELTVDSGLAEYTYIIPAKLK